MFRVLLLTAVFVVSGFATAQAGPYLCYKAIKSFAGDLKAVKGEIDNFKSTKTGCGNKLACSSSCRQARRAFKKEVKSSQKACSKVCKSDAKISKDKKQKKACIKNCKAVAKKLKKDWKDDGKGKCQKSCAHEITKQCRNATIDLGKALLKAGKDVAKIGAACSL